MSSFKNCTEAFHRKCEQRNGPSAAVSFQRLKDTICFQHCRISRTEAIWKSGHHLKCALKRVFASLEKASLYQEHRSICHSRIYFPWWAFEKCLACDFPKLNNYHIFLWRLFFETAIEDATPSALGALNLRPLCATWADFCGENCASGNLFTLKLPFSSIWISPRAFCAEL